MTQDDLLPEGLSDRLPEEARILTLAMREALHVMDMHGYDRVRPPLVEFERSMTERMEGVSAQDLFRFTDPASLRTLALRGDMTVQVGRIAATSLRDAPRPLRLCYAGEVMRIAGDQLDPVRQRLQIGAELIGSDSVDAACEIALVAIEALERAGASDISIDLTLPDLVDVLSENVFPLADDQRAAVRRELDTKDAGGLRDAGGEAYLPLLYAAGPFDEAIEQLAAIDAGGALSSRIAGLRTVASRIGNRARITLDPSERHGFEYQSWFGFTLYAKGAREALGRGGTYRIRGSFELATGFSLYANRLLPVLPEAETRKLVFCPPGHDTKAAARLRSEGWRTVGATSDRDDAATLGCSYRLDGEAAVLI
ncbi:ATP phosphoribosyltransferase regulatory subunit [Qipengyuania sp. JC766]|uniref:ATP phosphoribosyltransferase regulatory subunit n=1 Tax=Qipengyuania sp. JC766 TaxID=3232139 RepID=UPI003458E3F8